MKIKHLSSALFIAMVSWACVPDFEALPPSQSEVDVETCVADTAAGECANKCTSGTKSRGEPCSESAECACGLFCELAEGVGFACQPIEPACRCDGETDTGTAGSPGDGPDDEPMPAAGTPGDGPEDEPMPAAGTPGDEPSGGEASGGVPGEIRPIGGGEEMMVSTGMGGTTSAPSGGEAQAGGSEGGSATGAGGEGDEPSAGTVTGGGEVSHGGEAAHGGGTTIGGGETTGGGGEIPPTGGGVETAGGGETTGGDETAGGGADVSGGAPGGGAPSGGIESSSAGSEAAGGQIIILGGGSSAGSDESGGHDIVPAGGASGGADQAEGGTQVDPPAGGPRSVSPVAQRLRAAMTMVNWPTVVTGISRAAKSAMTASTTPTRGRAQPTVSTMFAAMNWCWKAPKSATALRRKTSQAVVITAPSTTCPLSTSPRCPMRLRPVRYWIVRWS